MFEPTSLSKLAKKGAEMHDMAVKGTHLSQPGVSPRGGQSSPRGSEVSRRSSSHFREIPANVIPESGDGQDESSSEEEQKIDDEERKSA